jgi:hypothetical protein
MPRKSGLFRMSKYLFLFTLCFVILGVDAQAGLDDLSASGFARIRWEGYNDKDFSDAQMTVIFLLAQGSSWASNTI